MSSNKIDFSKIANFNLNKIKIEENSIIFCNNADIIEINCSSFFEKITSKKANYLCNELLTVLKQNKIELKSLSLTRVAKSKKFESLSLYNIINSYFHEYFTN